MNKGLEALETIKQITLTTNTQEHSIEINVNKYFDAIEKGLKVLSIINKKGFDKTIKEYDNYDIWLEYKTEQFGKAIEKNPTILNWNMFDNFIYTKEEHDLLKEVLNE